MTTITRDELHAKWLAEQMITQEKTISLYFNAISENILSYNKMGNTKYKKILYKETDIVKSQVVKQLQSVFIDSKVVYSETDESITVDWSLCNN